jgi:hypothetical protein
MLSAPEKEFQRLVRACLEALGPKLTPVLASLIEHQYPREVVALDFEVFSDQFTRGFPVRAFFLDRENSEFFVRVNGEATYPSPVDPGLLEIDSVYPDEIEDDLVVASPDSDPWHIATNELFDWFLSCWKNAGGSNFRLAASIAHHDSSAEIDLITGKARPRGSAFSKMPDRP